MTVNSWGRAYKFCNEKNAVSQLDDQIDVLLRDYLASYAAARRESSSSVRRRFLGIPSLVEVASEPFDWPSQDHCSGAAHKKVAPSVISNEFRTSHSRERLKHGHEIPVRSCPVLKTETDMSQAVARTLGRYAVREVRVGDCGFDVVSYNKKDKTFHVVECKMSKSASGIGQTFGQLAAYSATIAEAASAISSSTIAKNSTFRCIKGDGWRRRMTLETSKSVSTLLSRTERASESGCCVQSKNYSRTSASSE